MRSMVEGTSNPHGDRLGGAIRIRQNTLGGDPQNPVPVVFQKSCAVVIALRLVAHVVNLAIHLDDVALGRAIEVDDIIADLVLTSELQAKRALAKALPEQNLGVRHCLAQLAGALHDRSCYEPRLPSTALRAVPLPVPGRNGGIALPHPSSFSCTTLPPWVSRIASPISSSRIGRPASLSQNAERKL
jgi:hypothetical protein